MTAPGPELDASAIIPTYRRWDIEIVSGSGSKVFDVDGKAYLDLVAGIAVQSLGHGHPRVVRAITEQAQKLVHVSNLYRTGPQEELAARLGRLTGGMLSFFANSGAEAIECALKLARKWSASTNGPGAYRVVAADGGFHGRTFGALAATGQPAKQAPFRPMLEGFTHVPFGDADVLAAAVGPGVAAVLLEPIQGEAGVIVPPAGYLAAAAEICSGAGCLLIVDEIQTGIGRTGMWFGFERDGVFPDVICLGKALGGGLPIAACMARPEIAAVFSLGDHGTTFGGGPVQSAAALATLETVETEGLVDRAATAGERFRARLGAALGEGTDVRGAGLLLGIALGAPLSREITSACLERGLLVNDPTPSVVRLTPPLILTDAEMDEAVSILEEVFHEVRAA
ncbi:MAG: acetylornithine transaminase [Actinomycetota bacterium]